MTQLCQELIWLNASKSTTCTREKGHKGEHSPYKIVPLREECDLIPMGISYTETIFAWYINIRINADKIFHMRIKKGNLEVSFEVMERES